MNKKTCKHNRMTEVLPGLWIGGARKHSEYTNNARSIKTEHVIVEAAPQRFVARNTRYFVCPNYGTPDIIAEWWEWEIVRYKTNRAMTTITIVTDLGGHGRSGLYCAIIMAHVLGLSGQDAIAKLRQMHCEQAVETAEQEAYVVRIADELRNWKG